MVRLKKRCRTCVFCEAWPGGDVDLDVEQIARARHRLTPGSVMATTSPISIEVRLHVVPNVEEGKDGDEDGALGSWGRSRNGQP